MRWVCVTIHETKSVREYTLANYNTEMNRPSYRSALLAEHSDQLGR